MNEMALSATGWAERESIIDRFEEAWLQGPPPSIDEFLPTGEGRREVLIELVHADLERRLERGEAVRAESYLERYPELAADAAVVADLVRTESELRQERQPTVSIGGVTPLSSRGQKALRLVGPRLPTFADFEVLEEIGRGGMGVVYRARQSALGRTVALKMILAGDHADDKARSRFRTEAVSVARLRHENIVQVYDVGEEEGRPYLALEYIAGGSLAQQLTGTPWPAARAAELSKLLARAAHHAHQAGIVHRDLKPANVLMTAEGLPKITDFGLARWTETDDGQTSTGAIVGTPSYMSPEQAYGRRMIGPAADIYALGAVLYELMTGRPPFRAATAVETLEQVRSQEPVPPSRLQPRLPRDLETICLKCLAKEPGKRYASADALADDLQRFQNGEPIRARPTPSWERLVRVARRRPLVSALIVLLLMVTAAGGAGMYWQLGETRANLDRAESNLYSHRIALADREWLANHVDRADQLLAECPPDRRGWEWHYLNRQLHRALATFPAEGAMNVAWSGPNGRYLAAACASGEEVRIWDASTGQLLHTLPHAGPGLAFSPDGKRLAAATYSLGANRELDPKQASTVKIWDVETGTEVRGLPGHAGPVLTITFSPDGSRLATGSMDRTAKVWNIASGKEQTSFKGHAGWVAGLAFSPDGLRIVSTSTDNTVKAWHSLTGIEQRSFGTEKAGPSRVSTGKPVLSPGRETVQQNARAVLVNVREETTGPWQVQLHEPHAIAFSPDGQWLAVGRGNVVKVWDAKNGQESQVLRGHTDLVRSLAFNHDGTRLVTAGHDQAVKLWDTATGEELATFRGHRAPVGGVAFCPDGTRIVSAGWDDKLALWDSAAGNEALVLRGHEGIVHALAAAPDGRLVASAGADRTVKLWDAADGTLRGTLTGPSASINGVAFDASGSQLAALASDGPIYIWDTATRNLVKTFAADNGQQATAFRTDGQLFAATGGSAQSWNLKDGTSHPIGTADEGAARVTAMDPSGRQIAWSAEDGTVRVRDATTGAETARFAAGSATIVSLTFGRDRLAVGTLDGTCVVWELSTGRQCLMLRGHTNAVTALAFSPDGKRLATGGVDRVIKIWETATGQEMLSLHGIRTEVLALTFTANGQRLVMAGADGTVAVWDGSPLPR